MRERGSEKGGKNEWRDGEMELEVESRRESTKKESKIHTVNTEGNGGPSCEMCVCIIGER